MNPQLDHLIVWSTDHDGGRGVYFGDPYTNVGEEIITRPYGSGPLAEQHTTAR